MKSPGDETFDDESAVMNRPVMKRPHTNLMIPGEMSPLLLGKWHREHLRIAVVGLVSTTEDRTGESCSSRDER